MNCHSLSQRISELQPELAPVDVARLCLLIFTNVQDVDSLGDDEVLKKAWRNASFRLEAALRAVKVQSQILELYTDEAVIMK